MKLRSIRHEIRDLWCVVTNRCPLITFEDVLADDPTMQWLKEQERESLNRVPSPMEAALIVRRREEREP